MGWVLCQRCETAAEVANVGKPWMCPGCGSRQGDAAWQKIAAGISGLVIVVAFGVLLAVIWAVLAAYA